MRRRIGGIGKGRADEEYVRLDRGELNDAVEHLGNATRLQSPDRAAISPVRSP
jgi:hypothetical protein